MVVPVCAVVGANTCAFIDTPSLRCYRARSLKMGTDYKNTLNLPRTDFPMKADLVTREPERLKKWEAAKLYEKIQQTRVNAEKFVLHDGPPFANGDVHIGTALNKILKDIIIKYKTLRGFSAPYIPGWDCHGLPIEFKVSQEMRKGGTTSTSSQDRDAVERAPPITKSLPTKRQSFRFHVMKAGFPDASLLSIESTTDFHI